MTAKKPRLEPRKQPVQRRSQDTVESILRAAEQVFERHGLAGGTTNRIAARAGVSIGTLYQYFPNKEAIAAALLEQHIAETMRLFNGLSARATTERSTVRQVLQEYVSAMLALHMGRPRLQHILLEEVPPTRAVQARRLAARQEAVDTVVRLMTQDPRLARPHAERAAYLIVDVVESLTHRYAAHPKLQAMGEAEFVAELVLLLEGYLVLARREAGTNS